MSIFILQNVFKLLYVVSLCGSIIPYMNNIITYISRSTMFLNGTRSMSFKNTKKVICERLELNYNDVEIYITWRCFVGKHQYFPILIAYNVDFKNMMEMPVQSGTNMMELYVSSQPKRSSSYNVEYRDTNISMPIFAQPFRQLSHSVSVGMSKTLEDRIIKICDENRIKTAYYINIGMIPLILMIMKMRVSGV